VQGFGDDKGEGCHAREESGSRHAVVAVSSSTQPAALHCCVTEGGEIAEDAMKHWKIDAGQLVQDEAVVSKKKDS
jgi:hypothetical protein